jgi:hypothetical protein
MASPSLRARFYDGSFVTSQSSRNAGKPMSGRWAIPGAWTLTYLKVSGQWVYLSRSVDKRQNRRILPRVERATSPPPRLSSVWLSSATASPRVITLDGFEATHAALRRMGMNNEFNYRSRQSGPDPHLPLSEQYCRTRSQEGKKPRGSNARLQALLQRSVRRGRCGVGPEDRKRSVRCSRKLRHGSIQYMVQHAGGVNLAPICNRSRCEGRSNAPHYCRYV